MIKFYHEVLNYGLNILKPLKSFRKTKTTTVSVITIPMNIPNNMCLLE